MQKILLRMLTGVLLLVATDRFLDHSIKAQNTKSKSDIPVFQDDATWAKLPENMKLGSATGLAVDSHDNVWVVGRRATVNGPELAAPPVIEFDADGNYIQGWGGPGDGYEWPVDWPHGIFIDYQDNVWICARGSSPDKPENQILKFTKGGKFLLQIGHRGQGKGSNDLENLGNPADAFVYPKTNEVFIADGYLNRRVIVFDATTGAFKRYWGAYGNKPDDTTDRTDLQQFAIPHQVLISNDGHLYVAVMIEGRIQEFTVDGKFVKEALLVKDNSNSVTSIAFSPDSSQRFMYATNFSKGIIYILDRQKLETVGVVGQPDGEPIEFKQPHFIATDSKGNLYIAGLGGTIHKLTLR